MMIEACILICMGVLGIYFVIWSDEVLKALRAKPKKSRIDIARVEITVASTENPNRVARLVAQELINLRENPALRQQVDE